MSDTVKLVLSGEVTLDDFSTSILRLQGLMSALAREVASQAEIEWVIDELLVSSTSTTVLGVGAEEVVGSIVEAYEKVGKALEENKEIPFSSVVIKEAYGLVEILNERVDSIRFETSTMEALVRKVPKRKVAEPMFSVGAYGAIEGRVQTLIRRRGLSFTLYDLIYDKAVSCYLRPEQEETMRDAWGKFVIVEGWVRRDPVSGQPLTIRRVRNVIVLEEGEKGDFRKARGIAPSDSPELPESVIRRLRDG